MVRFATELLAAPNPTANITSATRSWRSPPTGKDSTSRSSSFGGDAVGSRAILDAHSGIANFKIGKNTLLGLTAQPGASLPPPRIANVLAPAGAELDRALSLAGHWNLAEICRQLLVAGGGGPVTTGRTGQLDL